MQDESGTGAELRKLRAKTLTLSGVPARPKDGGCDSGKETAPARPKYEPCAKHDNLYDHDDHRDHEAFLADIRRQAAEQPTGHSIVAGTGPARIGCCLRRRRT